jgi:CRISPR/Cas system CMR-associated protein Cmr5 small subunit
MDNDIMNLFKKTQTKWQPTDWYKINTQEILRIVQWIEAAIAAIAAIVVLVIAVIAVVVTA